MKSSYFLCCLFGSQLVMKYLYILNKNYKSYQFAFESILKLNVLEGNYRYNNHFDLLDYENIKKDI